MHGIYAGFFRKGEVGEARALASSAISNAFVCY